MLNIPETVKTLFKADGIRKNFRVQFPDGELPDITNENIVQESVKFTESLCSQDVLKFGLTEASVIEFETVGVANMYGMTIECGIEIDLSSLSASEIAEIAAGSWDGVYVSETDTDIGFPFFRVPYGIFRVESCPRDHQAMTHRRVQAYSVFGSVPISPFEQNKLAARLEQNEVYKAGIKRLLYANIGYYNPDLLAAAGFEKQLERQFSGSGQSRSRQLYFVDKTTEESFLVNLTYYESGISFSNRDVFGVHITDIDNLFELDFGSYDMDSFDSALNWIDEHYSIEYPGLNYHTFSDYFRNSLMFPLRCRVQQQIGTGTSARYSGSSWAIGSNIPSFYPYRGIDAVVGEEEQYTVTLYLCKGFTIERVGSGGEQIYNLDLSEGAASVTINRYTDSEQDLTLSFSPTLSEKDSNGKQVYSYIDCYGDVLDLLNAYLEVHAQYGKITRFGAYDTLRLSNSSAQAITPGNYSSLWWDEYEVLPIGSVKFAYTFDKSENVVIYPFGSGPSIYDMTDNKVLKALFAPDESSIESVLAESFIPYLGPIAFTPIDLDMKGLPYLEAGDYLAVTAEDGVIAYSFAMRQEISGVQVLDAHIESTSGDIIESEASE